MQKLVLLCIFVAALVGIYFYTRMGSTSLEEIIPQVTNQQEDKKKVENLHSLSIEALRMGEYPGSDIVIEQTLPSGSNYNRYIASYTSEGFKIYALLTVPTTEKPEKGWPVVIFNHGYIPPTEYRTTERYIAYTDAFSRNGYIVLRSDYRGHHNSEGQAPGAYGSNAYTIDILNAIASIKKFKDADSTNIGMWGHSMGGYITLRSMVASKSVKAGVIWAGVVVSPADLTTNFGRPTPTPGPSRGPDSQNWRKDLIAQHGTPDKNPEFWNAISSNFYLKDISGPLQLHHGTNDTSVPLAFSEKLEGEMKKAGKEVEFFIYPGDDHNIGNNVSLALQRSVEFFDKYLKN